MKNLPKILVADPISSKGIEALEADGLFEVLVKTGLKEEETGGVNHGLKNFDNNYLKEQTGLGLTHPWKGHANQVTVVTYVRNCIHHPSPDNVLVEDELRKSLSVMKNLWVSVEPTKLI